MGTPVEQLVRILTASIAPVIVISGVGLLLLSMVNRYAHLTDRARTLVKELEEQPKASRQRLLVEQLQHFFRRAKILRLAIILGSTSIFFVVLTILTLFAGQVMGVRVDYISIPVFTLCLVTLLGSIYHFIQDVTASLAALRLEVGPHIQTP